ncbi:ankyrin repeat-containing domain protein [Cladorrhinum sp. PSN332]|nr:ankyrin repeat-containing domain protein [Cladorrhinum sp. PSN332]
MKEGRLLDEHREEIRDLYLGKGKTLEDVMDLMFTQRGVRASKITFKRKCKEWGIQKYAKRGRSAAFNVNSAGRAGCSISINPSRAACSITRPILPSISNLNHHAIQPSGSGRSLIPRNPTESNIRVQPRNVALLSAPSAAQQQQSVLINSTRSDLQPQDLLTWPWQSPWLSFLEAIEPMLGSLATGLPSKGFPHLVVDSPTHSSISFLFPSNSLEPALAEPSSLLSPGWSPTLAIRQNEKISLIESELRSTMPSARQGQHLKMATDLFDPRNSIASFSARVILHLFRLANNFTFWDIWNKQDDRYERWETIEECIAEYDEEIMSLFDTINSVGALEQVGNLLSLKSEIMEAAKEKLFASALRSGNVPLVQLLLKVGTDVANVMDDSDGKQRTPIHCAANLKDEHKSLEMVRRLLSSAPEADSSQSFIPTALRNVPEQSPVFPAIKLRHFEVVKTLIDAGICVDIHTLHEGIKFGDKQIIQLILDAFCADASGPELESSTEDHGALFHPFHGSEFEMGLCRLTSLGLAVVQEDLKVVDLLLERGMALNGIQEDIVCGAVDSVVSNDGISRHVLLQETSTTPLGLAVMMGCTKLVGFLLGKLQSQGTPIDVEGCTPLLVTACYFGHPDMVMALLDARADVQVADTYGAMREWKTWDDHWSTRSATSLLGHLVMGWDRDDQMDIQLCNYLIDKGARIDHALFEAVRLGNLQFASFLFHLAPSEILLGDYGQAAFIFAVSDGLVQVAEQFCQREAIANLTLGNIPSIKSPEMLTFLDRVGILKDILSANGPQILTEAVLATDIHAADVVNRLLDFAEKWSLAINPEFPSTLYTNKDWNHDYRLGLKPITPFDAAVFTSNIQLMRTLLSRGALWSQCTLSFAYESSSRLEVLDWLLLHPPPSMVFVEGKIDVGGFPTNDPDKDVRPCAAIVHAVEDSNNEMLTLFLTSFQWCPATLATALTAVVSLDLGWDFVQILLDAGATFNGRYESILRRNMYLGIQHSAVYAAVGIQSVKYLKLLIGAGAEPNPIEYCWDYETPLQLAARLSRMEMVNILLDAGANVNAPAGYDRATALQYAAANGHLEIVKRLLKSGARINDEEISYKHGMTTLQTAASTGRLEVLHLLLSQNPKISGRHRGYYICAVKIAEENGHLVVSRLLKSYAAGAWKDHWGDWYRDKIASAVNPNWPELEIFQVSEDEHELDEFAVRASSTRVDRDDEVSSQATEQSGSQAHREPIELQFQTNPPPETPTVANNGVVGSPSDLLAGFEVATPTPSDYLSHNTLTQITPDQAGVDLQSFIFDQGDEIGDMSLTAFEDLLDLWENH